MITVQAEWITWVGIEACLRLGVGREVGAVAISERA